MVTLAIRSTAKDASTQVAEHRTAEWAIDLLNSDRHTIEFFRVTSHDLLLREL